MSCPTTPTSPKSPPPLVTATDPEFERLLAEEELLEKAAKTKEMIGRGETRIAALDELIERRRTDLEAEEIRLLEDVRGDYAGAVERYEAELRETLGKLGINAIDTEPS